MNLRKLIKWSLVLFALIAFKEIGGMDSDRNAKPVYLSTQKAHG